jgi:hypothetical protein
MILVSIVGDFHSSIFPIFYEFREKITKHIIVYDDSFSDALRYKNILKSLEKFNKKHNLNIQNIKYVLDEDSLTSILKLVSYLKSISSDLKEIYINTTDGLSNIGVVLGANMLNMGVKLLSYDMYENTCNITSNKKILTKKITSKMSIQDHFLLKGLKFVKSQNREFAHKYKKEIMQIFEQYGRSFKRVKADIFSQHRLIKGNYPEVYSLLKRMGLTKSFDEKMITGGLFEYYVYLLVCDLGFDDIEIGVEIKQKFSEDMSISNEFDILLMKDNHLHMIECKYSKNIKLAELVYKYSSLINLIDDDGKIIILTEKKNYSPDLYNKKVTTLSNHRRAFINHILIRGTVIGNKKRFIDDVKTYFDVDR